MTAALTGHMKRRRASCAALLAVSLAACAVPDPAATAPPAGPPLTVCETAGKSAGELVLVRGEFDGFGYELNSRRVTLLSDDLCSDRGAGFVIATLANATEAKKLATVQPRDQRNRIRGGIVTVSGRISKINERRFVELDDAVVREIER